jgi:hypothetical protein
MTRAYSIGLGKRVMRAVLSQSTVPEAASPFMP